MLRRFSIDGEDTNTAVTTILGLAGIANVRAEIYMLTLGSDATADNAWEGVLQRFTAAGTSTAVTPHDLSSNGFTALCVAGKIHTVEPTYTSGARCLAIWCHQRAPYMWQVRPGEGMGIVIPGTAANGAALQSITVSAAWNLGAGMHYVE